MKRLLFPVTGLTAFIILAAFVVADKNAASSDNKAVCLQDSVKIVLEEKVTGDIPVLYITDTALTTKDIQSAMSKGYGEIMRFIQRNKLQALEFMAWYYSAGAPWLMDIGIQTNKIPPVLSGRIQSRIQKGGKAIVAHMWGPYDELGKAYAQIDAWLSENGRKRNGVPFEIYVNDASSTRNPLEIQTDVYQPIQ